MVSSLHSSFRSPRRAVARIPGCWAPLQSGGSSSVAGRRLMEGVKEAGGGKRDWSSNPQCLRLTSAARHCPGAHRMSLEETTALGHTGISMEESGQRSIGDMETESHQFLLPRSPGSEVLGNLTARRSQTPFYCVQTPTPGSHP